MAITLNTTYRIKSYAGTGRNLNVYGNEKVSDNRNVCLWTQDATANAQKWIVKEISGVQKIITALSSTYALNYYWGNGKGNPGNCDIFPHSGNDEDSEVTFIPVDESNNIYKVKLAKYPLYLTAEKNEDEADVTWEKHTGASAQQWKFEAVDSDTDTPSYIMLNNWLKMYTSPTSTATGRDVDIPTVSEFTGSDGYSYSFTNDNYWYAYENPYTSGNYINPYAYNQIKKVTGSYPIINIGSNGEYTDENGNYWMAVGPNVVNPNHRSDEAITPEEMYGRGKLDVVVKDSKGTRYYIPGVVGDAKAHTWDNGVIQTFKSYPYGELDSARGNFNGKVCAEFIGNLSGKFSGFRDYSIEKIIFYDN